MEIFLKFVRILSTRLQVVYLTLTASYLCGWGVQWLFKQSEFAVSRGEVSDPIGSHILLYTVGGLPFLIVCGMVAIMIADFVDSAWRAAKEE
jgi:hypothetical protein